MSVIKIRERLGARMRGEESGFTLVELLVVMLILGLLAAIAIPAFFNQRDKARDADAKSAARTAQTAIETYATDNGGSYLNATPSDLTTIEPTLTNAGSLATDQPAAPAADAYTVSVRSDTGTYFWISRASGGTISLGCGSAVGTTSDAADGGCPGGGNWGGEAAAAGGGETTSG